MKASTAQIIAESFDMEAGEQRDLSRQLLNDQARVWKRVAKRLRAEEDAARLEGGAG